MFSGSIEWVSVGIWIDEAGWDDLSEVILSWETAEAIKFLRVRNLIHRDIKPQVSRMVALPSDAHKALTISYMWPCTEPLASPADRRGIRPRSSVRYSRAKGRRFRVRQDPSGSHHGRDALRIALVHGSRDSALRKVRRQGRSLVHRSRAFRDGRR